MTETSQARIPRIGLTLNPIQEDQVIAFIPDNGVRYVTTWADVANLVTAESFQLVIEPSQATRIAALLNKGA